MAGPVGTLLIVLGCLALLAALWLSRRPAVQAPPSGLTPRRAAALRRAAGSLDPDLGLCTVELGDDEVRVRVAGPDPPSPPWRVEADGSWQVSATALTGSDDEVRPGLFLLGRVEGRDLLVDLGCAPGLVAVGGDAEAARTAVLGGVRDLLARTRPSAVEVTMVERDLDGVLATLPTPAPVSGALVGRVAPPRSGRLRLLVLWRAPDPDQVRRLHALVEDPRAGVAALCVGDTVHARWRLSVARGGAVDLGVLRPVPQGRA